MAKSPPFTFTKAPAKKPAPAPKKPDNCGKKKTGGKC